MTTLMKIKDLWQALESEGLEELGTSGWILRLTRPHPNCPLFIAIERPSGRRAIFLQLPSTSIPPRKNWPHCRGLETIAHRIGKEIHFGVTLKDQRFTDVFSALAEDLARRVDTEIGDSDQLAKVFIGQLGRWQKFLASSQDGLTTDEQLGLWGELHFLRAHLIPYFGPKAALGWKGGEKAHQDFQFENGAVEVKTTRAKSLQLIRISSERQLDHSGWDALFLHIISLEVRDDGGETLPDLIASLRTTVFNDAVVSEALEDGLLGYGYLDTHVGKYLERSYILRSETTYQVKQGFPCLVEKSLPAGVGEVSYGISVGSLDQFIIDNAIAIAGLRNIKQKPEPNY